MAATKPKTIIEARLGLCVIGWRSGGIRWSNGTGMRFLELCSLIVAQQVESCVTNLPALMAMEIATTDG